MTNTKFEMRTLYNKISELGFRKKYIRAMLPSWWDDTIAENQAGFLEAALLLSKAFSLDFESLISQEKAKFNIPIPNFKVKKHIESSRLNAAVALSSVAAKAVLKGFDTPLKMEGLTAKNIRETLLSRGNQWIDFRTLIEYCWEIGIPVLHLELNCAVKMQGLAISLNDRPVIILTGKYQYGYLVFDLAHELGHILAQHTKDDIVIDNEIFTKTENQKEMEANKLALEILTGNNYSFYTETKTPAAIADECISIGKEKNIDPAHLALSNAYSTQDWITASQTLKQIKRKLNIKADDPNICKEEMLERLNFEEMGDLEHPVRVMTLSLLDPVE